jgi:ABC-type polysaccharide/polyol phosphate transport system ATPase subunit
VSRRFRVVHERNPTLKEALIRRRRSSFTELWALRDVDLSVGPGEAVGIVGRNGSGKSTLLKVLAGIIPPHSGTVAAAGSLASLLELGSGFHPDFTGRENVFMNGAIHGLTQRDVADRIDEIIAFSEVGDFIDMPVRTYSSGMQMRLAFAVASHVNPDILLLDEVLAVGDEAFQRKCMGRIASFLRGGGTLIFVSHDPNAVEQVCSRAVLMDRGTVVADSSPSDIVRLYHRDLASAPGRTGNAVFEAPPAADDGISDDGATTPAEAGLANGEGTDHPSPLGGWGTGEASVERVVLTGPTGETTTFVSGDEVTVRLDIRAHEPIEKPNIGIGINSAFDGKVLYGSNTHLAGMEPGELSDRITATFRIPALHLQEGRFSVSVAVVPVDGDGVYHWIDDAVQFDVMSRMPGAGMVALDGEWQLDGHAPSGAADGD